MRASGHAGALALGLLVALAGMLAVLADTALGIDESLGLRWLFAARGAIVAPKEVVVVALDEPSALALGLPDRPKGWPRRLHAELVRYLVREGASVIGFDLLFDTPSADPGEDAELARAFAAAGNVIITESIRAHTLELAGGVALMETAIRPIAELADAARATSAFLLPKANRVNTYWAYREGLQDSPSLPVMAYQVHVGAAHPAAHATLAGAQPYLNYYGPPRSITTVPYSKALQDARSTDRTAPSGLAGKAVFIGYSAATPAGQDRLRDDYRTVYSQPDGLDLSGVEIAATAFANLLEDRPLRPLGLPEQLALAAAWGLLLGLVSFWVRLPMAILVAGVSGATYLAGVHATFAHQAWWWPVVVPVGVQLPLALGCGVALHFRRLKKDREAIKRAIGFYLPHSVVEDLARDGGAVMPASRVVYGSCLASDIEGYTGVAEVLEPAALGALMNDYFAALFAPVEKSGGAVVDVVGDAMVAIWTKPNANRELRTQACRGALGAVTALAQFNEDPGRHGIALPTRFGLHAGEMLVGSVGGSGHYEYRAVGDIINTASRIQGLNKVLGTQVLASAETVDGLEDIVTRPLGAYLLAGKSKPVDIVEIIGLQNAFDDAQRSRLARFAEALAAYQAHCLPEAVAGFSRLLEENPDDGPTRLYKSRCEQHRLHAPDTTWTSTIEVSYK